jgi:hypothetical protein
MRALLASSTGPSVPLALAPRLFEFARSLTGTAAGVALAAVIAGWPGTAGAFLFEVQVVTKDELGQPHQESVSSSSLPVGKSSSQSWHELSGWGDAESEAGAAAGNVVSQRLIPVLSARSFAHWLQLENNGEIGKETSAFASARFVYGGFIIDGPPGVVDVSVNFVIEGGIGARHVGDNMGVTSGVGFRGMIISDFGQSPNFILGDLSMCERGGKTQYPCLEGGPHVFASGALFGVSVPGRFEVVAASPPWPVTVGEPFEIGMDLTTSAFAFLGSSGQGSGGAEHNFATAFSDFFNTAGLWDGGPLFNLPQGYTAHSLDGLVVDNRLVLPGSGGGGPAPVPAPPTLELFLLGAAAALAPRIRRGRRAGARAAAVVVFASVFAAGAGGVDAAPVTFGFTGRVTSASFGPDDQPYPNAITIFSVFSGRYTFDSSAADLDPASSVGSYVMAGSPFGLTVDIGGNTFTTANRLFIEVDDAPSLDAYSLVAGILPVFRLEVGILLQDPTGTALGSDALPLAPPPLAAFATRTLDFRNDILDRGLVHITGRIDSLTCLAGCPGGEGSRPLPAPPTLLLLSAPLGAAGVRLLTARPRG